MPGITGCLDVTGGHRITLGAPELTAGLSREPDYETCPIVATEAASACVFSPRLSFPVAGAATDPESGVSAGFYGEFFGRDFGARNAQEIARHLISLYRAKGSDFPSALDGTFVVLIWDSRGKEGLLCNDHYASRPVCYAERGGMFYFAPEPKGIAALPGFPARADESALVMMLNYGHLLSGATYYQGIQYLAPGSRVRIGGGKVDVSRYFEYLVNEEPAGADAPELADRLSEVMRAAIRKRVHHLKDIVIPISGGYDSRGILAIVQELTGAQLKTVSWGIDEHTPDADAYIGRRVSEFYGTEHQFLPRQYAASLQDVEEMVARVDGGSMDALMHPNELQLMRTIRHEIGRDYLLRGDEIFGFKGEARSEAEGRARLGLQDLSEYPDLMSLLNRKRRPELLALSRSALHAAEEACPLREPNPRKDYLHYYQKIRNFANRSNYYKLGVLEAANPWLDRDVVEFLRRIPAPCRIEKELYRKTLATHFPRLMEIPISTRNSLEDFARLMQENPAVQKFIRFHLLEARGRLYEIVEREPVEELVNAVLRGQKAQSAKVQVYLKAKQILKRVSPRLYETTRSKAQGRAAIATVSPPWVVLRLLTMKLVCDRLP